MTADVDLSEAGERMFPGVKTLQSQAEQLEQEIRGEAREPDGCVTLDFLPSIGLGTARVVRLGRLARTGANAQSAHS